MIHARIARLVGGIVLGGAGGVVLLASLGCGGITMGEDSGDTGAPAARDDAGASLSLDASGLDAGVGFATPEGDDRDSAGNAASCFDGIDQDRDGELDCDEDSCSTNRICCVGSTDVASCCEPVARSVSLALAGCPSGAPDACADLDARIVSGAPVVSVDHAIVPVSAAGIDGAIDFPELALQPRGEAITLRAEIGSPASTSQLDATAFGLWSPTLPTNQIVPLVAVVVSATRDDVSIVSGARVIARHPRTPGPVTYTIALEPTGLATVTIGDETLPALSLSLPSGAVVPVIFGRVTNDDGTGETTRLHSLEIERRACDLPGALGRDGALSPETTAGLDLGDAADPSVLARSGLAPLVAFTATSGVSNDERAIFVGTLDGDAIRGISTALDVARLEAALRGTALDADDEVVSLAGPHLHTQSVGGSDVVSAYFAYETDDLVWHVGHAVDLLGGAPTMSAVALGAGSFDDPTLLSSMRLLVRERVAPDTTRFVLFQLDGETPALADDLCEARGCDEATRNDAFVLEPSTDPFAFDRDEIAAPFALDHAGVTRIYYAGRRGTRWSLGMILQSSDGHFFRPANDADAVLSPTGQGSDAIGTSGPSAYVEGNELVLLYTGSDGAHTRLQSARMPIRTP